MGKPLLSTLTSWFRRSKPEPTPDKQGAELLDEMLTKNMAMAESIGVRDGRPVFSNWSTKRAIDDGMKASVWVYACSDLNAKSVGSVPLKVVDVDGAEVDSNLSELLARPNKMWTQQTYLERQHLHLQLGGNALLWKNRGGRKAPAPVLEIWLIHPDQIKPVASKAKVVSHYVFRNNNGSERVIPTEDIVHFQNVDPGNPYWGLSFIQAAAKVIDTEVEAITWNKIAMQNRAVADGMITFSRPLTREQ